MWTYGVARYVGQATSFYGRIVEGHEKKTFLKAHPALHYHYMDAATKDTWVILSKHTTTATRAEMNALGMKMSLIYSSLTPRHLKEQPVR
jgi:hypothetical protein